MKEEGKAFTKTTSSSDVPMFKKTNKQRRFFFFIIGYKKMKFVKSSSKHTKRQPYWFSKCSVAHLAGVAMSVVYLVRRQMDSGNKSSTRCPSRCML